MTVCESCGDRLPDDPPPSCVASGGWCVPVETLYDMPDPPVLCSDCKARLLMVMELGIDPGRHGENLRVPRGALTYHQETTP